MLKKIFIFCGITAIIGVITNDAFSAINRNNQKTARSSARGLTISSLGVNTGIHQNIPGKGNDVAIYGNNENNENNHNNYNNDPANYDDYDSSTGIYGMEGCLNDIKTCIMTAFPDGISDLYDPKIREAIMYGQSIDRVAICKTIIDRCRSNVRYLNGNIYFTDDASVWAEFNRVIIQPAYYSLVMGTTGMTPEQAENTCMLLDKNTYGKSFAATDKASGKTVTTTNQTPSGEYLKKINPFNSQKDANDAGEVKNNSRGTEVNNPNDRGYYARWDAKNGQCLIRVAAYNKNKLIYDNWGLAHGDDGNKTGIGTKKAAEIWVKTGDSFTCSKDAFEFSLKNATKSVALWGITSGTVAGGIAGAVTGTYADKDKKVTLKDIDCSKEKDLDVLRKAITELDEQDQTFIKTKLNIINISNLSSKHCNSIKKLKVTSSSIADWNLDDIVITCTTSQFQLKPDSMDKESFCNKTLRNLLQKVEECSELDGKCHFEVAKGVYYGWQEMLPGKSCLYKLKQTSYEKGKKLTVSDYVSPSLFCVSKTGSKMVNDASQIDAFMEALADELAEKKNKDKTKNTLIGMGIGAGSGAALGGIATGITSLVEGKQINCRIGDDLERVAFGKSYTIPTLRDYYVKWGLKLTPTDGPISSTNVQTYAEWMTICAGKITQAECEDSSSNSVRVLSGNIIQNACKWNSNSKVCEVSSEQASASNMQPQGILSMNAWKEFCAQHIDDCENATTFAQKNNRTLKCKTAGTSSNPTCIPDGGLTDLR